MPLLIPIKPVPRQTLQIVLDDQSCVIEIFQMPFGLFVSLSVNDSLIVASVIALNETRVVRSRYLGFLGDLAFQDTQGSSDPVYTGLGDRFVLNYIQESELPADEG
jgi:hypothetical protein